MWGGVGVAVGSVGVGCGWVWVCDGVAVIVGCTRSPVVIRGAPERGGATRAPATTHAAAASHTPAFAIAKSPAAVATGRRLQV